MKNEFKVTIESNDENNVIAKKHSSSLTASKINEIDFALPPSGRPKTLDGKYHLYSARIREDLFEYAKSRIGKDKEFQSINDYINRLIARDMLSK